MLKLNIRYFSIFFIVLSIFLFSYCDKVTEPNISTIKEAEKNIFVSLLNSNDSSKVVYELLSVLKAGSIVKSDRSLDSTDYTVPTDSWFFFIDDNPNMYWVHPCRYVFVDFATEKLTVYDGKYYPECFDNMKVVVF